MQSKTSIKMVIMIQNERQKKEKQGSSWQKEQLCSHFHGMVPVLACEAGGFVGERAREQAAKPRGASDQAARETMPPQLLLSPIPLAEFEEFSLARAPQNHQLG